MEAIDNTTVLKKTLKNVFGHDFEDEDQEIIINEVFTGNSDVYIDRCSRSGTSLCFQLPAILKKNSLTVVFVPTKILGQIQINYLKQRNINAEYLCCNTWKDRRTNGPKNLTPENMELQFLYVSVDKKTSKLAEELIGELNVHNAVSFIVFDEAQCISPSSHNYLQSYREVAKSVKLQFRNIRKIAIAVTATLEMRNDIINELGMKNPRIFCPEWQLTTYHEVYFMDTIPEPIEDLKNFLVENIGPVWKETSENPRKFGIIFCRKKRAVKIIEEALSNLGFPVVSYHGDLSAKVRVARQKRWVAGEIAVLATTQNCPIGLDGPKVSFIVHWSMPLSVPQIYQECRRFLQNSKNSLCRVYFSLEEYENISKHILSSKTSSEEDADIVQRKHQSFNELIDYCLQKTCRLSTLMAYFGSTISSCRFYCDVCRDFENLEHRVEEFLRYNTEMEEFMIVDDEPEPFEPEPIVPEPIESSSSSSSSEDWEMESKSSELGPEDREETYFSFLRLLSENYYETEGQFESTIKHHYLSDIARKAEYSCFICAETPRKYRHDRSQMMLAIKNSTRCGLISNYIKYFEPEETPPHHEIPAMMNGNENEYERQAEKNASQTNGSAIEIINVLDDSDSGSETP